MGPATCGPPFVPGCVRSRAARLASSRGRVRSGLALLVRRLERERVGPRIAPEFQAPRRPVRRDEAGREKRSVKGLDLQPLRRGNRLELEACRLSGEDGAE